MAGDVMVVEAHGKVQLWRLTQPGIRNAISPELKKGLAAAAAAFVADDAFRALVITGADEMFCAGGDLRSIDEQRSTVAVCDRLRLSHAWMLLLHASQKPVVTAVNGAAVGAGLALALAGDIVIASDRAYFMSGFPKVGALPDMAILYSLPRAVGMPIAKDMMLTNRRVDPQAALQMGLVSRVVPHETIVEAGLAIATEIAEGPSVSLGLTKSILDLSQTDSFEAFLLREQTGQAVVFGTDDFLEGVHAFREKRRPAFKGR